MKTINKSILKLAIVSMTILLVGVLLMLQCKWPYRDRESGVVLLQDATCLPPCCLGLTPGKTTAKEALSKLRSNPFLRTTSLEEYGSWDLGSIQVYWQEYPGGIVAKLQDGIVHSIQVKPPSQLTLEEIIVQFGMPEALLAYSVGIPENLRWGIDVYYPGLGMSYKLTEQSFNSPTIEPSSEIKMIIYAVSQSSLEAFLGYLYYEDFAIRNVPRTRAWKGYGSLFELYYLSSDDILQ
jgi:hypothetical protein